MIKKQNLWFMTLFSLILILGVYYITLPQDLLDRVNTVVDKTTSKVNAVTEENALVAMRVSKEEERQEAMTILNEQLTNTEATTAEKNNAYEQLKYLNEVQGKEESLEKKIKKEYDLDCFIKIDNVDVSTVCIANKHDVKLANNIMRTIQKEYKERMNITVKFQKK